MSAVSAAAPLALTLPIAAVLTLPAAAAAVAAVRGWTGRLKRTGRLGVHTLAASASDRGFEVANRVAAPVAAGAAGVGLVTALIVLVLPLTVLATIMVGVLGLVGMLFLLYVAAALGEQAARTVPLPARKPGSAGGWSCSAGGADGADGPDRDGTAPTRAKPAPAGQVRSASARQASARQASGRSASGRSGPDPATPADSDCGQGCGTCAAATDCRIAALGPAQATDSR